MDTINLVLIRFVQAFVVVFFAFILAGYAGMLVLLPLAGFYHLVAIMSDGLGFNGIFATLIAGPAVGYILYSAYNITGFYQKILNVAIDLFNLGKKHMQELDGMAKGKKVIGNDSADNATAS
jgi:hypothetical protein